MAGNTWVDTLNRESINAMQERFSKLEPLGADKARGTWRAAVIGPRLQRTAALVQMRATGFGGWWGKRLGELDVAGGEAGSINLFGDGSVERYPMILSETDSQLHDGQVLCLTYPPETRWPWRNARDELRALDENHLLGLATVDVPTNRGKVSAFLLMRT